MSNYQDYFNKAISLSQQNIYNEALLVYEKTIELNPKFPYAYNGKGIALHNQKKFSEAISSYETAIELDQNNSMAYAGMGNSLSAQNKFPEAIVVYNKALKINPNFAEAFNNKGIALKKQNNVYEALESYDNAIKIDPLYTDAYFNRGNALSDLKRYEEAIEAYDMTLKLEPNYTLAYANKENLFLNLYRNSLAMEDLKNCIDCGFHSEKIAKYFLENYGAENLSEANIIHIKTCLESLIILENTVDKLEHRINKHESSSVSKFSQLLIQKKKLDELKINEFINLEIDYKENSKNDNKNFEFLGKQNSEIIQGIRDMKNDNGDFNLHKDNKVIIQENREFKEMQKIKEIKFEINNSKDDINLLYQKISIMEENIKINLDKYENIIELQMENEDFEIQTKARNYFFGFSNTFSDIFITSTLLNQGNITLNQAKIPVKILSFMASFILFFGDKISIGFNNSIEGFLNDKNIKENVKKFLKISSEIQGITEIVGKTIVKIFENENKKKQILEIDDNNFKAKIEEIYFKIGKVFNVTIPKEIKKKLYSETYNNPAKRLGNLDANLIIERYLKLNFKINSIFEEEFSKFIVKFDEETSESFLTKSARPIYDTPNGTNSVVKLPDCCACLIF